MKRIAAFIFFLFFFIFVPPAFASAGSFDPSNITFDTSNLTFDLSNLNPAYGNWRVTNIEIYNNNVSTLIYSSQNNPNNVNCNSTLTHCSATEFLVTPNVDMSQVHILVWVDSAPIPYYLSSTVDMSSFPTPTPSPTPTATPTPTPLPQVNLNGNVYVDANSNGVKDTGENNYQGATVTLSVDTGNPSSTSQQTATTDANGNYSFTVDQNGNYWISLAVPAGYMGTTRALVNVVINGNTTVNFGIVQQASTPIVFSDDFTDADGTALTTHNSLWQVIQGTMPVIQNNTLSFPGGADPVGLTSFVLTDQCESLDFQYPSPAIIALHVRQSPNGQGGYKGYGSDFNLDGTTSYSISLYRDQTYLVSSTDFPKSALSTGWHNFKLCAIGNQLSNYLDNSLINSATDTTYPQGFVTFGIGAGNYIDNFKLTTTNRPPVVGTVTVSPNPVQINTAVTASTTFTDPDSGQTHTATANWGDGTNTATPCSVTEPNGSTPGSVSCSLSAGYSVANVYSVTISVSDGIAPPVQSPPTYVSVYNPTQSSIFTAGEHFSNPSTASPSTSGNVKFGLSYKYQGSMPSGVRAFSMDFNAASLHFNATTVTSLVVSNGMATLTGTGTLTGSSQTDNFLVTGVNGGDIRIQITDSSNNVIYDTQPGDPITATPTTSVSGQVIVH